MTASNELVLHLSEEKLKQIEELARRRGYGEAGDYVLALIDMDASLNDDDVDVEANFRQGWHEAMTGQVHPIEKLWDMVDDE